MKKLLTIFFLLLGVSIQSVSAQDYVFVLVDVSKSISTNQLSEARDALTEVLTGAPLSKAFVSNGNQQDLANFKLAQGDKIAVVKFGSLQTTLAISPAPVTVQNINADASQAINSISWTPTDNQTYLTLAKAKIAEYTKNHQINKYKLYIISDNTQDDYGPNGQPHYPDEYTRNLVEGYNTSTNQVNEGGYTRLKFNQSDLFALSFSPAVDISKYALPTPPPGGNTHVDTPAAEPVITLTSFADGRKDKPKQTDASSFTVSWNCNCSPETKFTVLLSETGGGKYKDFHKNVASNSIRLLDVPSGVYKITVSAEGASSATTFVETPSGSFGWVIFLVVLVLAMVLGYYIWNKKRQDKIGNVPGGSQDIFSQKSNGSMPGNSSSNSDYF